jgi:hypothetical protein
VRTENPWEANLFYVPALTYFYSGRWAACSTASPVQAALVRGLLPHPCACAALRCAALRCTALDICPPGH